MRQHRVRVLIDANIYLSFLTTPHGASGTIETLVEEAFAQRFQLLLPGELIDEIVRSLETKPFFQKRIDSKVAENFLNEIKAIAEHVVNPPSPLTSLTRDPKDDYLIACALAVRADYLVSGDKDLLVLGDLFEPLKIRTPSAFLAELG